MRRGGLKSSEIAAFFICCVFAFIIDAAASVFIALWKIIVVVYPFLLAVAAVAALYLIIKMTKNLKLKKQVSIVIEEFKDVCNMDGYEFESFCAKLLSEVGFEDVERIGGANDYGADIICNRDGLKYAIQCKCYANVVNNKAVQEVIGAMGCYCCDVGVVLTNSTFTLNAKHVATANGIELWDGDVLTNLIAAAKIKSGEIDNI